MLETLEKAQRDIMALKIQSALTDHEQKRLDRLMRQRIDQWGSIRLCIVVESYPSLISAEDLYDDLRAAKLYAEHITKMAVIGDQAWKETWVALFGLFGGVEAAYFDRNEFHKAWQWLNT